MKFLGFFLLILFFIDISSCGKALEADDSSSDDNECSLRFIAGQKCIVCEKGGVSCDWD